MRTPNRPLLILAATALVCAGLFLSCAKKEATAEKSLGLLPHDSTIVVSINMKKMAERGAWEKLNDAKVQKGFDEFIQKTGMDPRKDLDRIVLGLPPDVEETKEFALLAFGTFDQDGSRPASDLPHADVEDEDGGLEDVQPQDLFHQVPSRDEDIEPDHHQEDEDPVVVEPEDPHRSSLPRAAKK